MQNIPLASSSSIDPNNLVLVMNGNNPTTTNTNNNNNNKQTPQQPLFMNSQSFLPKQQQQQPNMPQQPIIFFQNHLMPQTQQNNSLPNVVTNSANSTSSTPVASTTSNTSNTSQNGEVDVEHFAKFQQEQAKQFSLFQQQQAAAFLQLAIQQKQLEVAQFASAMNMPLPNGFLIPPNTNTSTNFHGGLVNSQPIFIPNNHHNPVTPFDQNSPMSESILSSSPSNITGLHHVHHAASSSSDFDAESTAASVSDKSQVLLSNQRRTGPVRRSRKGGWSEEEDEMLRAAVQTYGGKNWKKIAETLQNRTSVQCLHRWQKVLNPNLVKGPWTKDEDDKILQLVKTYGPENWSMIASHLPGRIGKQCRERWYNHLDPSIKKEPWTEEEETLLLDAQSKLGNKWAEISKLIVGRTDNACKNHFNSLIAREKKKDTTKETSKSSDSTSTRKTKKTTKKEDSSISRARHKRSISDTAFYQNYQYESRDSGPLTLSPMAQSNNSTGSGGNSPNANNLHHANTNSHSSNNNFFSNLAPPALFPFNSMMMQNPNLMQQNVIPLFRQNNVQKQPITMPASQNAFTQNGVIPNIDISSPNSLGLSTPTDLFHDLSAFEAIPASSNLNTNGEELAKLDLVDVQDTLINQVGSGLINNFDVFEAHESEVLIHSEDSNEEMNITPTPGSRNRPSTVFNEDMDFNEFDGESDLNNFLDDDNNDDQTNSGLFAIPFADRETKRKKFNHVFHNRSISFDVSQLGQNKDFFL